MPTFWLFTRGFPEQVDPQGLGLAFLKSSFLTARAWSTWIADLQTVNFAVLAMSTSLLFMLCAVNNEERGSVQVFFAASAVIVSMLGLLLLTSASRMAGTIRIVLENWGAITLQQEKEKKKKEEKEKKEKEKKDNTKGVEEEEEEEEDSTEEEEDSTEEEEEKENVAHEKSRTFEHRVLFWYLWFCGQICTAVALLLFFSVFTFYVCTKLSPEPSLDVCLFAYIATICTLLMVLVFYLPNREALS